MTSASNLSSTARRLLQRTIEAYRGSPETQRWLRGELDRIDAPLRVAIAGKVKAGKSTLLNAMVGEMVAATDAAECTKLVTWYQYANVPRLTLYPKLGAPRQLPASRRDGRLIIDLGATPAADVDRLVVDWPSRQLKATTLIDTPGIGSLTTENSERSAAFLLPEDEPAAANAVVYLMRHLHATDFEFLEAFSEYGAARASGLNAIAVLSRADEIGGGRLDALMSARRVAARYRSDPRLLGLCQDVVAVAGLLAQAGRSLRQDEFQAFSRLASAPRDDTEAMLLSVGRFVHPGPREDALLPLDSRRALLDRFGLFGVRLATTLVRQGSNSPDLLAAELVRRSGLDELRSSLGQPVHGTPRPAQGAVSAARRGFRAQARALTAGPQPARRGRADPGRQSRVRRDAAAGRDPLVGGDVPRRLPRGSGAAARRERDDPGPAAWACRRYRSRDAARGGAGDAGAMAAAQRESGLPACFRRRGPDGGAQL